MIEQKIDRILAGRLSEVNLNIQISKHIDAGLERFRAKILQDFKTRGITDLATKNELIIMDDSVVAENQLMSRSLLVDKDAEIHGSLTVKTLCLKGSVNTDNTSWNELSNKIAKDTLAKMTDEWRQSLVDQVLALAKTTGIDFNEVRLDGESLVSDTVLNPKITSTSITKTGTLEDLTVEGRASLNETLTVDRRRVGVNTDSPEMALSVWDEEVSIVAGKIENQKAYIGTSRLTSLAIGVNRLPQIEINVDGLTTIKQLRIGRHKIAYEPQVPGYSGTRGEIVFNSDPNPDQPFAWQCLGGVRWQPLKVSC